MQLMIYEGLFKLSTDSMDMIDDILNGECVCAVHAFFRIKTTFFATESKMKKKIVFNVRVAFPLGKKSI